MVANRDTFGGWLAKQEGRQDEVGHVARYWASIKDKYPRVRALPSIEVKMREEGALADGAPTNAWWAMAIAEYRGTDAPIPQVSAVPPAGPAATTSGVPGTAQTPAGQQEPLSEQNYAGDLSVPLSREQAEKQFPDEPADRWDGADAMGLLLVINAKLDWLHDALTSEPGSPFPPWPQIELTDFGDQPLSWDRLHELADFEAEQG